MALKGKICYKEELAVRRQSLRGSNHDNKRNHIHRPTIGIRARTLRPLAKMPKIVVELAKGRENATTFQARSGGSISCL
jgi:hypothetical protein